VAPAPPPAAASEAPRPALAAPPPGRRPLVAVSLVAGLLTALVPMAVGGSLLANDDDDSKHRGIYVMQSGLLLAPFVSHAVAGEWARGALFALPGVAGEAAMVGILTAYPDVSSQGLPQSRIPFAACLGLSLGGAAAGLVDSLLAGERWDRRHLRLAPSLGPHQAAILVGGTL
jgi:hypothetical protein